MTCTAPTHEAKTWRSKTCRCEVGRADHNRIARISRKERELGRPRRVPAGPVQRQVRDLMAAGWPAHEIAPRIGWGCGELHTLLSQRTFVARRTAERVAAVWGELHAVAGPSATTRRRAARADLWLPPIPKSDGIDRTAIDRACDGDPVRMTQRERREAVRQMHGRGLSYDEMAQRLHTHTRMVHRDLTALGLTNLCAPAGTVAR